MAHKGKIYPDAGAFNSTLPFPGSYYNVKEQQLPAPVTYQRGRRCRSGCCCFLTCLCSIFTVVTVLLFCLLFLIFLLVVQPRTPRFDIENVHISGLNTSSSPANPNIAYVIMVRNPNKRMSFYYDDINVSLEAYGVTIGDGSIPSFHQGHKNTTFLSGDVGSEGVTFNWETITLLTTDPTIVPLYAVVDVKARVRVGSIKSSTITIKVRCGLNVDLTRKSGSQLTYKHCWVKW